MRKILLSVFVVLGVSAGAAPRTKKTGGKPPPASLSDKKAVVGNVYFEDPQDGATVNSKFTVKMAVMGYTLKPAGSKAPNSGHHHIIVDSDPIPAGTAIPMSPKHLHYGKAQTEADIELPPGKHILILQFGDGNHVSYGPDLSQKITVTVEK